MYQMLLAASLAGIVAAAEIQDGAPEATERPPQKSPLFQMAERFGRAAGNAEYCGFDDRDVENFIVNAMAQLAAQTDDQVLLAGSRIEFNAHAAYGRSEGPGDGCEAFELTFRRLRRGMDG